MAVKHAELTSIDAKRFSKPGEKIKALRIDNNSTVTLITELNPREANIEFRYTANYGALGIIKIEGNIRYEGDAHALVKEWSTTGNMPPEVANEVHTAIMRICLPEAVMLSRDIKLPPPIPLPKINIRGPPPSKTTRRDNTGMEVA